MTEDNPAQLPTQLNVNSVNINVGIIVLEHGEGLELPSYKSDEAAGVDLRAAIHQDEKITLKPNERKLIPTGISLDIPKGYEGQIRPRSGLALNNGITVLNSPGTIDSDYTGEIKVILYNTSEENFVIERGARIAQLVFAPVTRANFNLLKEKKHTKRSENGFGSTGMY